MAYSIGEFSHIVRMSIKTLRHYHEEGILPPSFVDPDSGYRYYNDRCLERARIVAELRAMEFSVAEIRTLLVAGIRFQGRYAEVGDRILQLFRSVGRQAAGKPLTLYYDSEYREEGADIEASIPVRKPVGGGEIRSRIVEGGPAVVVIHRGPYEELGRSYRRLFDYVKEHELQPGLPLRETYLKGPGMLRRGNPKRYLTELLIPVVSGRREEKKYNN